MKRLLTAAALIPVVVYVVLWANFWLFLAVLATVACSVLPRVLGHRRGVRLRLRRRRTASPPDCCCWSGRVTPGCSSRVLALDRVGPGHARRRFSQRRFPAPRCCLPAWCTSSDAGGSLCRCARQNPHWLMYALLLNWAGDSGAYYVGRAFGRHKMAPRVSPKKSWEGAAASVADIRCCSAGWYLVRFVPGVTIVQAVGSHRRRECRRTDRRPGGIGHEARRARQG